jgi:tellurite methyltransferase
VLSEQGRSGRLGSGLNCLLCDRREMPAGFSAYKKTKVFDERSIPAGLLAQHHTKAGVWALIHVSEGELEFRVPGADDEVTRLSPGLQGVIVAEVEHCVRPCGPVSFFVEFWRASAPKGD